MYLSLKNQIVGILNTFEFADLFDPEYWLTRKNAECCLLFGSAQGLTEDIVHVDGHPQIIKNCKVEDAIGTRATDESQTAAGDAMYLGYKFPQWHPKGSFYGTLVNRCECGEEPPNGNNHYAIQWYGGCKLCPVDSTPKNPGSIAEFWPEDLSLTLDLEKHERQPLMFPACLCENNGKRVGFNALQQKCCGPNEVFVYDDSNPTSFYGTCKQCPVGTEPDAEYGRVCTSIKELPSTEAQVGGIFHLKTETRVWSDCYDGYRGTGVGRTEEIEDDCKKKNLEYKGVWESCEFLSFKVRGLCELPSDVLNIPSVHQFQCKNNDHALVRAALGDKQQCKTCPSKSMLLRSTLDKQDRYFSNYHQCTCENPKEIFNDISQRCQVKPTNPCPRFWREGLLNGKKYCFKEGNNPCPDGYTDRTNSETGKKYCGGKAKARNSYESDYCLMGDIMNKYGLERRNWAGPEVWQFWGTTEALEVQASRTSAYPHGFPQCHSFDQTHLVDYQNPCPADYIKYPMYTKNYAVGDALLYGETNVAGWHWLCKKADAEKRCSLGDYDAYDSNIWETSTEGLKLKPCVGAGLMCSIGDLYVKQPDVSKSVAFYDYGNPTIAIGYKFGTILTYNPSTGAVLAKFSGHTDAVNSVAIYGTIIVSGSSDNTTKIWDANTQSFHDTDNQHLDAVLCVAISSDGTWMASGSKDMTIKIHDVETHNLLYTLEGHTSDVLSVAFSPDSSYLASGSKDESLKIWNMYNGELIESVTPNYFERMFDAYGNEIWPPKESLGFYNQFNINDDTKSHDGAVTSVTWSTSVEKSLIDNNGGTICDKRKHIYHEDSCERCKYGMITHGINDWCCQSVEEENCFNRPTSNELADTTLLQIISTFDDGTFNIWNFDKNDDRKLFLYTSIKQLPIQSLSYYGSGFTRKAVAVSENSITFYEEKTPSNNCRLINFNVDAEVTKSQCEADIHCTLTYKAFPIDIEDYQLCDSRKSAFHPDSCARCVYGHVPVFANDACKPKDSHADPVAEPIYNIMGTDYQVDKAYGAFCVPNVIETTAIRHQEYATGVAVSSDGSKVVTGGQSRSTVWDFDSKDKLKTLGGDGEFYGTQAEAGFFDETELYEDLPDYKFDPFLNSAGQRLSHFPETSWPVHVNQKPRVRTPERELVAPVCVPRECLSGPDEGKPCLTDDECSPYTLGGDTFPGRCDVLMDETTNSIIHNGVETPCPDGSIVSPDAQTCICDPQWGFEYNSLTHACECINGYINTDGECITCGPMATPNHEMESKWYINKCECELNFQPELYRVTPKPDWTRALYASRCVCSTTNRRFLKADGTCQICHAARNINNEICVCASYDDSMLMGTLYNYETNDCCDYNTIVHNGECTSCPANSIRKPYDFTYDDSTDINEQIIEKTAAINTCICNNNYYYDSAQNECVCTDEYNAYVSGDTCVTCPANAVASGNTCICDSGAPYIKEDNECCDKTKVVFNGKCELCPEGSTVSSDQSECIPDDDMRVYNPLTNNLCPVDNFLDPNNNRRKENVNVYAGNDAGLYGLPFPLTIQKN